MTWELVPAPYITAAPPTYPHDMNAGDIHATKVPFSYSDNNPTMFVGVPGKNGDETAIFIGFRLPEDFLPGYTLTKWRLELTTTTGGISGVAPDIRIGLTAFDGTWENWGFPLVPSGTQGYLGTSGLPFATADGNDTIIASRMVFNAFLGGLSSIIDVAGWTASVTRSMGEGYTTDYSLPGSALLMQLTMAARSTAGAPLSLPLAFSIDPYDPQAGAGATQISFYTADDSTSTRWPRLFLEVDKNEPAWGAVPTDIPGYGTASALSSYSTGGYVTSGSSKVITFAFRGDYPHGLTISTIPLANTTFFNITWTPSEVGTFPLTLRATDSDGFYIETSWTVTVTDEPLVFALPPAPLSRPLAPLELSARSEGAIGVQSRSTGHLRAPDRATGVISAGQRALESVTVEEQAPGRIETEERAE